MRAECYIALFLEARNYARQREAFGGAIIGYPLVQETLVRLLERCWRHRVLTFQMISLLDEHGMKPASEEQSMWQRFLINLAKYRTSVTLTDSIREAILIFGGNGIVEDFTILPRLLRDAISRNLHRRPAKEAILVPAAILSAIPNRRLRSRAKKPLKNPRDSRKGL